MFWGRSIERGCIGVLRRRPHWLARLGCFSWRTPGEEEGMDGWGMDGSYVHTTSTRDVKEDAWAWDFHVTMNRSSTCFYQIKGCSQYLKVHVLCINCELLISPLLPIDLHNRPCQTTDLLKRRSDVKPNQTKASKPNQTKPNQTKPK